MGRQSLYTEEFRKDAVPLYRAADGKRIYASVAADVGISGVTLRTWVRKDTARNTRSADHTNTGAEAEADELARLRAENAQRRAVSPADGKRRRMLTEIAAHREEHGNARVPANYVTADGEQVGQWLYRAVKKWRANALPDDERRPLAALGVSPGPRPRGTRTSAQSVG